MRRITLTLALLLAGSYSGPAQTPVRIKTIPVSEVSGAVNIGNDRVLLVADEGYDVRIVSRAAATFKAGATKSFARNIKPAIASVTVRENKKLINDLEDATWDSSKQVAFVITSHSLNKDGEEKPARYKLARLVFKNGKMDVSTLELDSLKEALKQQFPFVSEAMTRSQEAGGNEGTFNIEGLAFDPRTRSLLLGLRSPTQVRNGKPCAVVLTLKNPHELFQKDQSALPEFDPEPDCLDFGGLGIRGMTYDAQRRGYWIIAGRSDDSDSKAKRVPSSLWFWDSAKPDKPARKAQTASFRLLNLEAVCLLRIGSKDGLLLISDDGDGANNASRYVWITIPKLIPSARQP